MLMGNELAWWTSNESLWDASEKEHQAMNTTGCRRETPESVPREPILSDMMNDPVVMTVRRANGRVVLALPGADRPPRRGAGLLSGASGDDMA
jgi:hypothetical protein